MGSNCCPETKKHLGISFEYQDFRKLNNNVFIYKDVDIIHPTNIGRSSQTIGDKVLRSILKKSIVVQGVFEYLIYFEDKKAIYLSKKSKDPLNTSISDLLVYKNEKGNFEHILDPQDSWVLEVLATIGICGKNYETNVIINPIDINLK